MNAPSHPSASFYTRRLKRPLDVIAAVVLLALLWPLMLAVAAAVWLRLGRPILFIDRRGGLNGREFGCLKFRTMTNAMGESGALLPDAQRITALGSFLRAASLDELPQLVNVLRGEMSLVGPRPLTAAYLDRYTAAQARRHEIRPGITGWAQVQGRNALGWERKFELDVWYVDHLGFWLDAKILLLTAWRWFDPRELRRHSHAPASEFIGSDSA